MYFKTISFMTPLISLCQHSPSSSLLLWQEASELVDIAHFAAFVSGASSSNNADRYRDYHDNITTADSSVSAGSGVDLIPFSLLIGLDEPGLFAAYQVLLLYTPSTPPLHPLYTPSTPSFLPLIMYLPSYTYYMLLTLYLPAYTLSSSAWLTLVLSSSAVACWMTPIPHLTCCRKAL